MILKHVVPALMTLVLCSVAAFCQFSLQPPVTVGGTVLRLAKGDINADGLPEVGVATTVDLRVVSVQTGITPGGWALGRSISWGAATPQPCRHVAFGDLDGVPGDEVLATTPSGVRIFGVNGATTTDLILLATIPNISTSTTVQRLVTVADLDGDGDLDILFNEHSTTYSFRNDGNLLFTNIWSATHATTTELVYTDWNGDLIGDLFIPSGQSRYFPGIGDGTFSPSVAVSSPLGSPVSAWLCRLSADDVSNDLLIFYLSSCCAQPGLEQFVSFGPGVFTRTTAFPNVDSYGGVADLDGDPQGVDDLVLKLSVSGIPEVRINPGNGNFVSVTGTPLPLLSNSDVFVFLDANGDGITDILSEGAVGGTNDLRLVLNLAPVVTAALSATPSITACGAPVMLDASASTVPSGRTIVSYGWDFGDGASATTAVPTIQHVFAQFGTYSATVTVTDDIGRTSSAGVMINVNSSTGSPVAIINGPYILGVSQDLHLSAQGIDSCGGTAMSFAWDLDNDAAFDDAVGATPLITAAQLNTLGIAGVGSHPIQLRVTDAANLIDIDSGVVTVVSGAVSTITGYTVTGLSGRVEVRWTSLVEPSSLTSYRIDRAPAPGGPFVPQATLPRAGPTTYTWVDISAPPGLPRTYRLVEILTGGPGAVLATATAVAVTQPTTNQPQAALFVNGQQPSVVDPAGHEVLIPTPGPLNLTVQTGTNTLAPLIFLTGDIDLGAMPTVIGTIDLVPSTINVAANGLTPNPAAFLDQFMYTNGGNPSTFSLTLQIPALTQAGPAVQFIVFDPNFPPFNLRVTEAANLRFEASASACPTPYSPYEPPSLHEPLAKPGRRRADGSLLQSHLNGPGGETDGIASPTNPLRMALDPAFTYTGGRGASVLNSEDFFSSSSEFRGPGRSWSTVHLHSGDLLIYAIDLVIPGVGTDFVWARTYRSRNGPDTRMGRGWSHSYDVRLESAGGNLRLFDGQGREDVYVAQPDGTWAASGLFRSLRTVPGGFVLTFEDRGEWQFFALNGAANAGRLSRVRDRNGNVLILVYDGTGRLDGITDTLGRFVDVQYTPSGAISKIVDPIGREVVYAYDGAPNFLAQRLLSVTLPAVTGTPNGNNFPAGRTTTYTYRNGTGIEALDDNILGVTDANGQTFMGAAYDEDTGPSCTFDHILTKSLGASGDLVDFVYEEVVPTPANRHAIRRVIVNDRVGQIREFLFDVQNRCVERREFTGRAPDADGPTSSVLNRPLARLRPGDPSEYVTAITCDTNSLPLEVLHANGSKETFTWDAAHPDPRLRGNLLQHRVDPGPLGGDQPNLTRSYTYHPNFGGGFGARFVAQVVNRRGHVTARTFDGAGNLLHVTHPIAGVDDDFTYDPRGRLTSHRRPANASGHRRRDDFTYHSSGPQNGYPATTTLDSQGVTTRTVSFTWDSVGHNLSYTDPGGFTWLTTWTALDEVVRLESPTIAFAGGARLLVDFYYDANGNLIREDRARFDETGQTAGDGYWSTTYTYEVLNLPVSESVEADDGDLVITHFTYDANRNLTRVSKGEAVNLNQPGNIVDYEWDERDLLYRIRHGQPVVRTDQVDYDGIRRIARRIRGVGPTQRVESHIRDGYGRLDRLEDPMGNRRDFTYDEEGNVTNAEMQGELIDVPGGAGNLRLSEESAIYDALHRRVTRIREYFDPATQAPIGDGQQTTTWIYAPDSQVMSETNDNNHTTTFLYDQAHRLSQIADAAGNTTTFVYDTRDNVTSETRLETSGIGGPPTMITTTCTYDEVSRRLGATDGVGNTKAWRYDSRSVNIFKLDGANRAERVVIDGLLRKKVRVIDMNGNGASASDASDIVMTWNYDDTSRLISETDDNGHTTSFTYDTLDRQTSVVSADGTQTVTIYDAQDDAVLWTDANGSVRSATYDRLGRPTEFAFTAGAGVSNVITFESRRYDGRGLLVSGEDDATLFTRSHDSLGYLSSENLDGRITEILRDALGSVLSLSYPGGRTVNYGRDVLERISSVVFPMSSTTFATWSWRGRASEERVVFAGGMTMDAGYDGILRPTSRRYQAGMTTHDHVVSTFDANHRRTSHVNISDNSGFLSMVRDPAYRLTQTQVAPPGGAPLLITYMLDGVGNRTQVTGGAAGGIYVQDPTTPEPADAQMNQYTSSAGQARTYDRNGNLLHRAASAAFGTGALDLEYDVRNRLVESINQGTGTVTIYRTDLLGRRVERSVTQGMSTTTRRYFYLESRVIEEENGLGGTAGTYVLGPGGRPISLRRGAQDYVYHQDDTGAVVGVSDSTAQTIERYRYGPFGELALYDGAGQSISTTQIDNHWTFRGYHDAETGLYLIGGRYYDPQVGQFTSRDVARPVDGWKVRFEQSGGGASFTGHDVGGLEYKAGGSNSFHGHDVGPSELKQRFDRRTAFEAGDGMNGMSNVPEFFPPFGVSQFDPSRTRSINRRELLSRRHGASSYSETYDLGPAAAAGIVGGGIVLTVAGGAYVYNEGTKAVKEYKAKQAERLKAADDGASGSTDEKTPEGSAEEGESGEASGGGDGVEPESEGGGEAAGLSAPNQGFRLNGVYGRIGFRSLMMRARSFTRETGTGFMAGDGMNGI